MKLDKAQIKENDLATKLTPPQEENDELKAVIARESTNW